MKDMKKFITKNYEVSIGDILLVLVVIVIVVGAGFAAYNDIEYNSACREAGGQVVNVPGRICVKAFEEIQMK